jgi:hypothetical protein
MNAIPREGKENLRNRNPESPLEKRIDYMYCVSGCMALYFFDKKKFNMCIDDFCGELD